MPFVLNLIYLALLLVCSPRACSTGRVRSGKYREGWAEKVLGKAPLRIGDRPCLWFHAVSVGEVLLLRPLVARAGAAPAGLGGRRLDDDDAPAWRWRGGPIPTWSPSTPRSTSAGRPAGPSRGSGRRCWPWSSWSSGRTWSGRRSGPGRGWRSSTAGSSPRSHRGYRRLRGPLGPTLRRLDAVAVADRGVRRAVRRPGRPAAAGPRHRLGQVRRPGERPEQPQDAGPAQGARARRRPTWSSWPAARWRARRPRRWRPTARRGSQHPGLRLVLVPRHAERFEKVAAWLEQQGERSLRRSRPDDAARRRTRAARR